tara:strand:+ start:215 stop:1117 length:903 start_codon:yes stop_codon:yes gene_type:complete
MQIKNHISVKNRLIYFIIFSVVLLIAKSDHYKTLEYQYKVKKYDALRVYFDCSIGNLIMKPSKNRYIINGNIDYNSTLAQPIVELSNKNNISRLDLKVKPNKIIGNDNTKSLINSFIEDGNDNYIIDFEMPTKISTDMNLNFGLGKVDLDFSGLRISQLLMKCGLSDVTLINTKSNIINCDKVSISTGVSDFNSRGLGNFNASNYLFDVGMGSAEIDMSGSANRNLNLKIDVTIGSLELKLPQNKNIELIINKNMLSSVNVKGLISSGEGKYTSKDTQKRWATMKVEVSVGIGSVDISAD